MDIWRDNERRRTSNGPALNFGACFFLRIIDGFDHFLLELVGSSAAFARIDFLDPLCISMLVPQIRKIYN